MDGCGIAPLGLDVVRGESSGLLGGMPWSMGSTGLPAQRRERDVLLVSLFARVVGLGSPAVVPIHESSIGRRPRADGSC